MINKYIAVGKILNHEKNEIRRTNSGKGVLSFNLCIPTTKKDEEGHYISTFVPCIWWGIEGDTNLTFLLHNLAHNGRVAVIGRVETRTYNDDTGKTRYVTEVIVENLDIIDFAAKEDKNEKKEIAVDDDLPF